MAEPSSEIYSNGTTVDLNDHFDGFLAGVENDLRHLRAAAVGTNLSGDELHLRNLVDRVVGRFDGYYQTKTFVAQQDVRRVFAPRLKTTSSENMLSWVGGWRPTVVLQILYSKSGIQLESRLEDVLARVSTNDLAELSVDQLRCVDEFHRRTVQREREIEEAEAVEQEQVGEKAVVQAAQGVAEMKLGEYSGESAVSEVNSAMEMEMKKRREGMAKVVKMADELRLQTIKGVVEILRPIQAVHFLIAAVELLIAVHDYDGVVEAPSAG